MATYIVRPFQSSDITELLDMMKALAVFEGYMHDFKVTEQTLTEEGLGYSPSFHALVAESAEGLLGYSVFYQIPFTYHLKPTVVMKELFVKKQARGLGVGSALFDAVTAEAKKIGAARLQWLVLPTNEPAKQFYKSKNAKPDPDWEHWQLTL